MRHYHGQVEVRLSLSFSLVCLSVCRGCHHVLKKELMPVLRHETAQNLTELEAHKGLTVLLLMKEARRGG